MLTTVQGDLFNATDSLCHCVSSDLKMGRGIALAFRKKFGRINELKSQHPTVGGLCILEEETRYIYYLVTKRFYYEKPTYETLKSSLVALREHMISHNVKSISMPLIGCGLDRLQWNKVKELLYENFEDTEISINVYSL